MATGTHKRNTKPLIIPAPFLKGLNALPMDEALSRAGESGAILSTNKGISIALLSGEKPKEASTFWTGTMAGYREPGKKLGSTIEYSDPKTRHLYVFPVPEDFRGMKDVVLVAEHPDVRLERTGSASVIEAKKISAVGPFPHTDGWYAGDPAFDIPCGKEISGMDKKARHLVRQDHHVGLIVRECGPDGIRDRDIGMTSRPSYPLGIMLVSAKTATRAHLEAQATMENVILPGLTRAEFTSLLREAKHSLENLAGEVPVRNLLAIRRLLDRLDKGG
jgi:hypothetical protein